MSPSPAVKTPVPSSDDSDLFYSPEDSLNRGKLHGIRGRSGGLLGGEADGSLSDSLMLGHESPSRPGIRLNLAPEFPPTSASHPTLQVVSQDEEMPQDEVSEGGDVEDDCGSMVCSTKVEEERTKAENDQDEEEMPQESGSERASPSLSPSSKSEDEEDGDSKADEGQDEELPKDGDSVSDSANDKENEMAEEDQETSFVKEESEEDMEDPPASGSLLV